MQSPVILKNPLLEDEFQSPFSSPEEDEFFSLVINSRLTLMEEKKWYEYCKRLNAIALPSEFKEYDEKKNVMYNLVL